MSLTAAAPRLLLDACSLLNVYATRRIHDILAALPESVGVVEAAAREILYVRRGGSGEDADERDPIDLTPLFANGMLQLLQVETNDEAASYVAFAAELDDGEAMTCALALHRGAAVATDDRKATRVLGARAPQVTIYTTAHLLKTWADTYGVSDSDLRAVLTAVRERARFVPPRWDPLQGWWLAALRG